MIRSLFETHGIGLARGMPNEETVRHAEVCRTSSQAIAPRILQLIARDIRRTYPPMGFRMLGVAGMLLDNVASFASAMSTTGRHCRSTPLIQAHIS